MSRTEDGWRAGSGREVAQAGRYSNQLDELEKASKRTYSETQGIGGFPDSTAEPDALA
jgi:hypothetical protein